MLKETIKETIAEFIRVYPPSCSLDLRFGPCRIRVQGNRSDLIEKLRRYFGLFVAENQDVDIQIAAIEASPPSIPFVLSIKQPDPGKNKIKEEFKPFADGLLVRKRLTGMVFFFGRGNNLAIGPCLENDNQVINFIINRFIQWDLNQGSLLLHAAGISFGGKGLAISGFSGMGKSTLALHLMNRGATFISNDRLMVKMNNGKLRMTGVPKLPRVNPGTLLGNDRLRKIIPADRQERYLAMAKDDLWALEEKYDVFITEIYGENSFELDCDLLGIAVLNWQRNGEPLKTRNVHLKGRMDLIPAFAKDPGLFYEPDEPSAAADFSNQAYLALLGNCQVYELSGGVDFEAAATFCLEFLTQS